MNAVADFVAWPDGQTASHGEWGIPQSWWRALRMLSERTGVPVKLVFVHDLGWHQYRFTDKPARAAGKASFAPAQAVITLDVGFVTDAYYFWHEVGHVWCRHANLLDAATELKAEREAEVMRPLLMGWCS